MDRRAFGEDRRAEAALLGVTVVWGLTFSMVKRSLDQIAPFVFMTYRFALATLVMLPFLEKGLRGLDRRTLGAGTLLGTLLYSAYSFQTFGLQRISAGNAGFITGLFVVFAPARGATAGPGRPPHRPGPPG
jgi:drug/metabolite transporter (DMT)-like permease